MDVEVRLKCPVSKEKGLYSNKFFKKGSVILKEDPLICVQLSWNAACGYKSCDHCLKPLETTHENVRRLTGKNIELPYADCCESDTTKIVPCELCAVDYCSLNCRSTALEQYHQILCLKTKERDETHPLEHLNEFWKRIHYPPETNSIMLIVRLLARISQSTNREEAIAETLEFCHRTTNENATLAHKLLGEKFADQAIQLRNLFVQAVTFEGVEQFLSEDGFLSLLALIGTNGQGIGTSPLSQWVTNVSKVPISDSEKDELDKFIDKIYEDIDDHTGPFINTEGVGLYSLQSKCNHSCTPNAEPSFLHNSSRLSLVATRDIDVDDEIFISYLDECSLERSRHSRQKELVENYMFHCDCPKCEAQAFDEDITSEEEMSE